MADRVTIKTLARDLGISHMTVSRALSDHPSVRPATREAITARARELGYVRSAAAAAMRGEGTRILGLVLPNLLNAFYASFANRAALLSADGGFHLVTHMTGDDPERERLSLAKLAEVQAAAAIVVPAPAPGGARPGPAGLPVIHLIRTLAGDAAAPALRIDDRQAIADAVASLAGHGHRKVAYLGGPPTLTTGVERRRAFEAAAAAAGLALDPDLVLVGRPSSDHGRDAIATLLGRADRPDAVLCGGFEITEGALTACLDRGVRFPRDLAFVGYGDAPQFRWLGGGLSAIRLPIDALAREAVRLAASPRLGATPAPVALPATFVPRASSARGRGARFRVG